MKAVVKKFPKCAKLLRVVNATASSVVSRFDCAYDAAGRLASVARSGAALGSLSGSVDRYSCNARGEVTLARRTKGGLPVRGFSEDFAYDLAGNRTSSATYDETGAARTSTYAANGLNQYASRTSPGFAAMRGEADPDATVTVNGRPAFRLGAYFFGGDEFDNSESGGLATLVAYAAKAQADDDGGDADDLVACATGRVYVARSAEAFAYDADGNQTLVTTGTGRWRVEYDGENRPVRWTRESDGKVVAMSYDHMGRRRTKDGTRFYYDGYLQVANERTVSNAVVRQHFVWDPTEPAATRPLAWVDASGAMRLYAHDWNKNVSEVVSGGADAEVLAHYDYAAFGAVVAQSGACAEANPWRFSSEHEDSDLGLVYYNYRHYDPLAGRWLTRDPIEELDVVASSTDYDEWLDNDHELHDYLLLFGKGSFLYDNGTGHDNAINYSSSLLNLYRYVSNASFMQFDELGLAGYLVVGAPTAAACALADGPLPIGDIIGLGILVCCAVADQSSTPKCPDPPASPKPQIHYKPNQHGCPYAHWHKFEVNQGPWPLCKTSIKRSLGGCIPPKPGQPVPPVN